jgi:hypothetical protein
LARACLRKTIAAVRTNGANSARLKDALAAPRRDNTSAELDGVLKNLQDAADTYSWSVSQIVEQMTQAVRDCIRQSI